ncbi:ribonucleotide-diphosphate reductase subunit alpha [Pontibacillus halophilus JSM 076056 = DSM 19796]|uniref:Ribonucleoside-diphosphate reductase n=1 Tax=Pontibacillus halophilus JSM 076056 = DSM 19796 TaxID=1385510 RepID=A0A0A5I9Q3_9BACI|nr:ribonucleotide-diphosphate reductase subunit alpha [Pontibacillus halophilus JSM 076056 = DSM 19796]
MIMTNERYSTNDDLLTYVKGLKHEFPHLDLNAYQDQMESIFSKKGETERSQLYHEMVLKALDEMDETAPDWTYVAERVYLKSLYEQVRERRGALEGTTYPDFYELLVTLREKGVYSSLLLNHYDEEEIRSLSEVIEPARDLKFTYIGLRTLADRYLARDHERLLYELPQERFLVIAMTLMAQEPKEKRAFYVKEAYWAISQLYMTVATPTLANAGKDYGQLSSCFIDTVDDSLQGIFDSNTDIANLSKAGGGIGAYLGKIRSQGSDIRGYKGVSSGVIPWMKQLNNTAVSVDQLGQRQGAIAVYLDVWHPDIFRFLDAKLNNGDERLRTHDLFTGVCIPDLFMEAVQDRDDWHLFDPHEVRSVMGFSLEDYYDEKDGEGSFREKYALCVANEALSRKTVPAIDIMKRMMISQLETGTPYMFYRDEVNRKNPNSHKGMVYCSNLCTEITQNQSATTVSEHYTEEGKIITVKEPGDFVVCNLSSINLGRAVPAGALERLIPIQMRMLDNVIDLNTITVLQAQLTNHKYRGVGLGTFGWHHLLANEGIRWESEEAVDYSDKLYERIAYLSIEASKELAKEKGSYPVFEGSEWETGAYFDKRGYKSTDACDWEDLKEEVQEYGVRNGYMMAVAPNSSTSIIAGSTASIDPIFQKFYSEEKKNYKIPVTAPDLNRANYWYYKSAYDIDQKWSIRQNAARQRHMDQSVSFNLYVRNNIKAKDLLELHIVAWKEKLKTTYYTRSTSTQDLEECESCSS